MTQLRPTDEEKKTLGVLCPFCRASAGRWCTSGGLFAAEKLHARRLRKAGILTVRPARSKPAVWIRRCSWSHASLASPCGAEASWEVTTKGNDPASADSCGRHLHLTALRLTAKYGKKQVTIIRLKDEPGAQR